MSMTRRLGRLGALGTLAVVSGLLMTAVPPALAQENGTIGDYKVAGPFTYKNLTLFVLRGRDQIKEGEFLTLEEALRQKKLIVYETGNVNQLQVENIGQVPTYIQAGEIVKGGRQDRVLEHDLVVPPKSGRIKVSAYCVESGRWTGRSGESSTQFEASSEMLATKAQKLASRAQKDQGAVWGSVAEAQEGLTNKVGAPVQAARSPTSLQLTLENERVEKAVGEYVAALTPHAFSSVDTVGFAFAINGQPNSIEALASHAIFVKMWPKLLKAAAVEAVLEYDEKLAVRAVAASEFTQVITDAEKAAPEPEQVTPRVRKTKKESATSVEITTEDAGQNNAPLRKTYIKK